ncbi:hypothetical protein K2P47_03615 [Patescibacteria group bacterium]|nr:hypothetical protein [Patescibacteria group bacterium]
MNRIMTLSVLLGVVALGILHTWYSLYGDYSVVESDDLAIFEIHLKKYGRSERAMLAIYESTDQMFISSNGDVVALDDALAKEILKEGVLSELITGTSGIKIHEESCDQNSCDGEVLSLKTMSWMLGEPRMMSRRECEDRDGLYDHDSHNCYNARPAQALAVGGMGSL